LRAQIEELQVLLEEKDKRTEDLRREGKKIHEK
jgi:hypothetical protein